MITPQNTRIILLRTLYSNSFLLFIYLLVKWRLDEWDRLYSNNYDILLEGYPRSSNTYTLYMLLVSQKNLIPHGKTSIEVPCSSGIRLKGHTHNPALVIHAVRHGKPICFLIRRPDDAIVSWHIAYHTDFEEVKGDNMTLEDRLDYYIYYHKVILPYKKSIYIANFDRTTTDFKSVVAGLIEYYGIELSLDFDNEVTDSEAKKLIQLFNTTSSGKINTQALHLPSKTRADEKLRLSEELNFSKYSIKLAEAWRLYQEFQ
jgi:hypothetical protein